MKYFLCLAGGIFLGFFFSTMKLEPPPKTKEQTLPRLYQGMTVKHRESRQIAERITGITMQNEHWYPCGDHQWVRFVVLGPDASFVQFWEGEAP